MGTLRQKDRYDFFLRYILFSYKNTYPIVRHTHVLPPLFVSYTNLSVFQTMYTYAKTLFAQRLFAAVITGQQHTTAQK